MSSPLHLDVFVVPYEPIAGLIPPMSTGEPTWPATSVSLISGERDAVLIDAALTPRTRSRQQAVTNRQAPGGHRDWTRTPLAAGTESEDHSEYDQHI